MNTKNNLIYDIHDRPPFGQLIVFAIQQLLAIMAATLVVPIITNGNWQAAAEAQGLVWDASKAMSPAAALFGAGVGTMVYLLFTQFCSPVFLGSSFAFLGSMAAAFSGSIAVAHLGLILGAAFAGLVYVVIAIIVKLVGVGWINKLMPPVVIGPTVSIIGLGLAANAIGDFTKTNFEGGSVYAAIGVGLVTLFVTMLCSTYGKKTGKLIPFIFGVLAGYATATIFYVIGVATGNDAWKVIDYSALMNMNSVVSVPNFTFLLAKDGIAEITSGDIATVAVAYIPVALVVFAEHIADHKNLSSIIGRELLEKPGLHRTLLGDGIGSIAGAAFGGCPNTTYGESVGCVAITRNASVATIATTAILAVIISFLTPFVAFVNTIPSCVMGGMCITLYGFIAVSGLKMIQKVNLGENKNLFVVSVILIAGIGGLTVSFGKVTITSIACALILGIVTNLILSKAPAEKSEE